MKSACNNIIVVAVSEPEKNERRQLSNWEKVLLVVKIAYHAIN